MGSIIVTFATYLAEVTNPKGVGTAPKVVSTNPVCLHKAGFAKTLCFLGGVTPYFGKLPSVFGTVEAAKKD